MKRSVMAKKILRKLKEWEGCQKTIDTANEILDIVEEFGMLPPEIPDMNPEVRYEWEQEKRRNSK